MRVTLVRVAVLFFGNTSSFSQEVKPTPEYYNIKNFKFKSGEVMKTLKIKNLTGVAGDGKQEMSC